MLVCTGVIGVSKELKALILRHGFDGQNVDHVLQTLAAGSGKDANIRLRRVDRPISLYYTSISVISYLVHYLRQFERESKSGSEKLLSSDDEETFEDR